MNVKQVEFGQPQIQLEPSETNGSNPKLIWHPLKQLVPSKIHLTSTAPIRYCSKLLVN